MIINVKISPRASKAHVEELKDDNYRVKLVSSPEEGAANKELVEVVAEYFGLKKNQVEIVGGLRSRDKKVEIMVE